MRARFFILFSWLLLFTASGYAVEPYDPGLNTTPITDDTGKEGEVRNFWQLSFSGDHIGKSRFRTGGFENEKISYTETEELLAYNWYLDRTNLLSFGLAYGNTGIHWAENPDFHHHSFEDLSITAAYQNNSFKRWLWRVIFSARFSLSARRVPDFVQYTQTLWGRFDLTDCYGVHAGYIAETGLRKDTVWPIIGFDYQYSSLLKFYCVYPIEASVNYAFCKPWALELATKPFRYHQRVRVGEPVSKGLLEYRNLGTEIRLCYEVKPYISANVHVGQTYGGELRMANSRNKDTIHYKFRTAPYVGGEFTLRF